MQETQFNTWVGKIRWRSRLPTPVSLGFPCDSARKESACNVGDLGSIPGLGRSPGEEKVYPLQYSGLETSMDCIVHGVTKSQTWLSNFYFYFPLYEVQRWLEVIYDHLLSGIDQKGYGRNGSEARKIFL